MDSSVSTDSLKFFNGPEMKNGGSIALGTAVAGVLGGVAASIGLGLAINGAIQAFNPQP